MEEKEFPWDDDGYDLVDPYIKDPYVNLANAIVIMAARDYRKALYNYKIKSWHSLEKFFNSKWYRLLTNVPADEILSRLRDEQREKYETLVSASKR